MSEWKGCTRSHPHENMSAECEFKTEQARTINQLANELAATKQKLEAAEQAIRESQEQEPEAWIVMSSGVYLHIRDTNPSEREDPEEDSYSEISYIPLYAKPVIIPQSAEQLHIKELRESLVEIAGYHGRSTAMLHVIAQQALAKQPDTRATENFTEGVIMDKLAKPVNDPASAQSVLNVKLGVLWPKKHRYNGGYPAGICEHCGRQTGLDEWQLKDLPKEMAICMKGESATIWEILTGRYDSSPNVELRGE